MLEKQDKPYPDIVKEIHPAAYLQIVLDLMPWNHILHHPWACTSLIMPLPEAPSVVTIRSRTNAKTADIPQNLAADNLLFLASGHH